MTVPVEDLDIGNSTFIGVRGDRVTELMSPAPSTGMTPDEARIRAAWLIVNADMAEDMQLTMKGLSMPNEQERRDRVKAIIGRCWNT